MQQYGIVGYPLEYTLSPYIHNSFFMHYAIDAVYDSFSIEEKEIVSIMENMRKGDIQGLSITAPYKECIIPYLDTLKPRANAIAVVNTIYKKNGMLIGDNTDIVGIQHSLRNCTVADSVLVLGTGGTSKSVLYALKRMGIASIYVTGRNDSKSEALAKEFNIQATSWRKRTALENISVVVNTIPLSVAETILFAEDFKKIGKYSTRCYAFDVQYRFKKSPFLTEAQKAGWSIMNGLTMFVCQAKHQYFLWTGIFPECSEEYRTIQEIVEED